MGNDTRWEAALDAAIARLLSWATVGKCCAKNMNQNS